MKLKEKIHRTLVEEKENKGSLIIERKITQSKFSTLKRCKNYTELIENIIYQVNKFNNKGFNNTVISESLIKVLRTLFGDFSDEFYTNVMTKYSEWLSQKMNFTEEKEWISDAITKRISEVPHEDFEKLFNCRYLAELMTEAVMEGFEDKVLSSGVDKKMGGEIGEKFKELVVTASKDSGVQRDLEESIREKICPELDKVIQKMEAKKEQIKTQLMLPDLER